MRIAAAPAAKAYVRDSPRYIPKGDGSLCFHCTPGIRKQIPITARGWQRSVADERIIRTWRKVKNLHAHPLRLPTRCITAKYKMIELGIFQVLRPPMRRNRALLCLTV